MRNEFTCWFQYFELPYQAFGKVFRNSQKSFHRFPDLLTRIETIDHSSYSTIAFALTNAMRFQVNIMVLLLYTFSVVNLNCDYPAYKASSWFTIHNKFRNALYSCKKCYKPDTEIHVPSNLRAGQSQLLIKHCLSYRATVL